MMSSSVAASSRRQACVGRSVTFPGPEDWQFRFPGSPKRYSGRHLKPTDQEAEDYIHQKIDQLPRWLGGLIHRPRRHHRIWVRVLVGALLIIGGVLWFLPILGIWMVPLGFVLLASELPTLKRWLVGVAIRIMRPQASFSLHDGRPGTLARVALHRTSAVGTGLLR